MSTEESHNTDDLDADDEEFESKPHDDPDAAGVDPLGGFMSDQEGDDADNPDDGEESESRPGNNRNDDDDDDWRKTEKLLASDLSSSG